MFLNLYINSNLYKRCSYFGTESCTSLDENVRNFSSLISIPSDYCIDRHPEWYAIGCCVLGDDVWCVCCAINSVFCCEHFSFLFCHRPFASITYGGETKSWLIVCCWCCCCGRFLLYFFPVFDGSRYSNQGKRNRGWSCVCCCYCCEECGCCCCFRCGLLCAWVFSVFLCLLFFCTRPCLDLVRRGNEFTLMVLLLLLLLWALYLLAGLTQTRRQRKWTWRRGRWWTARTSERSSSSKTRRSRSVGRARWQHTDSTRITGDHSK